MTSDSLPNKIRIVQHQKKIMWVEVGDLQTNGLPYKKHLQIGGFNPLEKYYIIRLDHHPNYWGK